MKPVFVAKKNHRPTSPQRDEAHGRRLNEIVFTPACQHLPGFHTIARMTPWERLGLWFIIDF